MSLRDHVNLAKRAGKDHGREDAVMFLFAGQTDDDTICEIAKRLENGDQAAFESLPQPQNTHRTYVPTRIFLGERARGDDSPYTYYLDLCDAYDSAYNEAVLLHINTVARAIKEGQL